ncbi:MAG: hypothetical protein BEU04_01340 [Marine Group III euryarchaeote CG-Bathy1]|uniref:Crotonase n=1 Tax=Marine Group III euryarchaeote CG-Bathy1 TaxID=1889001 RepID=A0A1J5T6W4_9ARCH|nr:MAG: hypothetical protein BEU04_01340 [Marine Group III euryarchaeote CG-Bathy1]
MNNNVLIQKENRIGTVIINRPEKLNSLSTDTRKELVNAFKELEGDKDIRIIILSSSECKAFSAGADLKEFASTEKIDTVEMERGWEVTEIIFNLKKPVIAMIDGFCIGGGMELAMACDIRIASEKSKFGQGEINLAIIPGAGGTQRLPRLIGSGRAMEMILSGRMIGAVEAEKYGVVNFVYPSEEIEEATIKIAENIAKKSPFALSRAKSAVNSSLSEPLKKGLEIERTLFVECFVSEDGKEGIRAFVEKREPEYKDK